MSDNYLSGFGTILSGIGSLIGGVGGLDVASQNLQLSRQYQNQMAQYYANQNQLASNQLNEANRQFNVNQAFLKKQFDTEVAMANRQFNFNKQAYNDVFDFQRDQFQFQKEQQAWLDSMARNQHQREVADLRAAGLNPILSSGGMGSAMPSTVSAVAAPSHGGGSGSGISPVGSMSPTASGSAAAQFAANAGHALSSAASVSSALADAGIRGFSSAVSSAADFAEAANKLEKFPYEAKALAKEAAKSGKLAELYGEQAFTESTSRKAKLGLMQAQADAASASAAESKQRSGWIDQNFIEKFENLKHLNKYLDRAGLAQQVKAWSGVADTLFRGVDTGVNVFTKGLYRQIKPNRDFSRSEDRQLYDPEHFLNNAFKE